MQPLDGQVAIVTGGAKGIGLGIAQVLSAEGVRVVIADLDLDGATEAAQTVVHHGGEAIAVATDVRSARDPRNDRCRRP